MEVRNSNFAAFIDIFTSNTYVMVVMSDPSIRKLNDKLVLFAGTKSQMSLVSTVFLLKNANYQAKQ